MNFLIFCLLMPTAKLLLTSAVWHQALGTKFLKVLKDVQVLPRIFLKCASNAKSNIFKVGLRVCSDRACPAGPSDGWLVASKEDEQPVCMVAIRGVLSSDLCAFSLAQAWLVTRFLFCLSLGPSRGTIPLTHTM